MKTLTDLLEENSLHLEVVNVDFELAMVEAAMNSEESFEFDGDNYEVTVDRSDAESVWGTATEALTNAQRRKKAIQMKKGKASRMRKKKIAEKKLSSPEKIEGKSRKAARKVVEKKLLKGKDKSELSYSQRAALEKKVEKKKGAVGRIAKRLKKDVKKKDRERVKSRRSPKNEDIDVNEAKSLFEDSLVRGLANMSNGQSLNLEHGRLRITLKRVGKRVTFYTNLSGSPSSDDLRKKWDAAHPDFQYEELKSLSRKAMSTEYGAIKPATAYDGFTMTVKSMISKKNEDVNVLEEKSLEQKNTLTKAEYDEVQNFSNFDKKDWKKQGSKYVRVKPVKEDVEFNESLSQGMDQTLNAINLLSRSLKVGSNLNKAVDKAAEGKYAKDFAKMYKAILVVGDVYSDIVMDIETNMREDVNVLEEKSLEQKNTLTKAEYDEVQNFSNFDKKDWKKQGSKYVRVKPVKEDVEFNEALKASDIKKVLSAANKAGGTVKKNTIDFGEGSVIKVSIDDGRIKFDGGMSSDDEYFDSVKDAINAFEDVEFSEAFKVGQKVNVKRGPHTDVVHEVIAKLDGDKYNVKPVGLKPKDIKYPQGAAGAKGADLTLVKESADVDFEKAKSLTKAEYDEVQNFSNFDKKDWKKQGSKYVRVKEDIELDEVTEAAGSKYVLMSDKDTKEYPKNRAGLKAAYQDAAKSKIWVITFKKANGDDEIVDSSDN